MFDEAKLRRFRLHALQVPEIIRYHYRYVYSEDQNDFTDIHGKLWEMGSIPSAENKEIKISGNRRLLYPNGVVINLLQHILKFDGRNVLDQYGFRKTDLGESDLSIIPVGALNQFHSLLPHITSHDKIWINDMTVEGTATYFIDLFDFKLWIAFFVMFFLIGALSTFGIVLLKKFTKCEIDQLNWFSIIVNQGANENHAFISRRLLLITISIVTIMFHGAFGAYFSSFLAIRQPDLPFTDMTSLLNLPTYTICALPRTSAMAHITYGAAKLSKPVTINSDACPNIFREFAGTPNSIENSEMFCPRTNMVYIGPGMCFIPKLSEMCSLTSLHGKYFHEYVSMVIYPGFKYKEQFNRGILRLRSSGHLDYMMKQFNLKQLHDLCSKRLIAPEPDMGVTFFQIRILLVIMILGAACSIIILAFEIIFNRR